MTEDRLPLAELLAKADEGDFLRTVAEAVLQLRMEADVDDLVQAMGLRHLEVHRLQALQGHRRAGRGLPSCPGHWRGSGPTSGSMPPTCTSARAGASSPWRR
jgi:hypothetical protein